MRDGSQWLVGIHRYNAFPSGHTSSAIGLSATLLFARRVPGAALLCCAFVIAGSRIYLRAHHFSDVIAGMVLGAAVAWWLWRRLLYRSGPGRES